MSDKNNISNEEKEYLINDKKKSKDEKKLTAFGVDLTKPAYEQTFGEASILCARIIIGGLICGLSSSISYLSSSSDKKKKND